MTRPAVLTTLPQLQTLGAPRPRTLPVFSTVEQRREALRSLAQHVVDCEQVDVPVFGPQVHAQVYDAADRTLSSADRHALWRELLDKVCIADELLHGRILPREIAPGAPHLARQIAEDDIARALDGLVAT